MSSAAGDLLPPRKRRRLAALRRSLRMARPAAKTERRATVGRMIQPTKATTWPKSAQPSTAFPRKDLKPGREVAKIMFASWCVVLLPSNVLDGSTSPRGVFVHVAILPLGGFSFTYSLFPTSEVRSPKKRKRGNDFPSLTLRAGIGWGN